MPITCPWCGTSYLSFQSNCSNCGGPLPPPEEMRQLQQSGKQRPPKLLYPPDPPREIANNYIWRLMLNDGWTIFGFVFVLVGGIFSLVGAGLTAGIVTAFVGIPFLGIGLPMLGAGAFVWYRRYEEFKYHVEALRRGQATEGEITQLEEKLNVTVNGRHPWEIHYRFTVDGQEYEDNLSTLTPPDYLLTPGNPAVVLYLPEAPEHSVIYPRP